MNQNIHIGGRQTVDPEQVVFMKADINYTTLYFANGTKTIVATTLKCLQSRFADLGFYRPNRQFLVNRVAIQNCDLIKNTLQLKDGQTLRISRRRIQNF